MYRKDTLSQAKPSQAKPRVKYALFSLSIQELYCYFIQSGYSCVNLLYRKKAAFFLPAMVADAAGG